MGPELSFQTTECAKIRGRLALPTSTCVCATTGALPTLHKFRMLSMQPSKGTSGGDAVSPPGVNLALQTGPLFEGGQVGPELQAGFNAFGTFKQRLWVPGVLAPRALF